MNIAKCSKAVKKIVDSKDNIIEQLKELKKYSNRKGVRRYIDELICCNQVRYYDYDSKYILYCIVKYYYGLDAKRIVEPLPRLSEITSNEYDFEVVRNLLNSKDNIIEQCRVLKEHKDSKDVQEYIETAIDYYCYDSSIGGIPTEYQLYCIDKYYYGLKVPKVPLPPLRLYAYVKDKPQNEKPEESDICGTSITDLKVGDNIEVLSGAFKGLFGDILKIDGNIITVNLDIFGEETRVELNETDKVMKHE